MIQMDPKDKVSTVSNKYPTYRDDSIRGCFSWLEGKRVDDNAENLWRVHNKIYDLTDFIGKHPGGSNWIELTKVSKPDILFNKKCNVLYISRVLM